MTLLLQTQHLRSWNIASRLSLSEKEIFTRKHRSPECLKTAFIFPNWIYGNAEVGITQSKSKRGAV
jgi:hypothetical protein